MKKPDIKKVLEIFSYFSSGVALYSFTANRNQIKNNDVAKQCTEGYENLRKTFQSHIEQVQNTNSIQNEFRRKMLESKTDIDNLLSKIKKGEAVNSETDPGFKAIEELKSIVNQMKSLDPVEFEAGPVNQEQISNNLNNAVESFKNVRESSPAPSTNSIDLLSNNNLISEITDAMKSYTNWVSSLEIEQIVYVLNISVLSVVFFSTTTLMTIFYSDWLITKFNIEKKFPRIGKIVQLRRKIQNYSFFINSLIIFIFTFSAFAVNLQALIDSFSN